MKTLFIFSALTLGVATLNTCTQEDTTEVPVESRMKPASNMRELTEQLKAYDARFVRNEEMPLRLPGGVKFNKLDYAKIAISDVCGGIRGSVGGVVGAIGGAVSSSLIKACKIYAFKYVKIKLFNKPKKSPIATFDGNINFPDSIGFFHNTIEYALYEENNNSHQLPVSNLIKSTNDRMLAMSPNYRNTGGLTNSQISYLATDLERMKNGLI